METRQPSPLLLDHTAELQEMVTTTTSFESSSRIVTPGRRCAMGYSVLTQANARLAAAAAAASDLYDDDSEITTTDSDSIIGDQDAMTTHPALVSPCCSSYQHHSHFCPPPSPSFDRVVDLTSSPKQPQHQSKRSRGKPNRVSVYEAESRCRQYRRTSSLSWSSSLMENEPHDEDVSTTMEQEHRAGPTRTKSSNAAL